MPAAQKIISSEGMSGVLNLKRSKIPGRRGETKWRKKFAVLKSDTLHLYEGHDENGKGEDESHTVYLSKYKECTHILDKRGRKKPGFTLIPTDHTYEQWMLSCEEVSQQEKWISQLNSAISGNVITIINYNFDELTVQSPTLQHLGKTRPKYKGRRAPSKRPSMEPCGRNGDISSADDMETGVTTVDSVNPAKKPRSEMTTSTSPVKTPEESKASAAKAFFRGIGLKFTTALGRQKSIGAKTPQSPEPEGAAALEIAPEHRMCLSDLMSTLQIIEEQSGIIVNKAAALRVLFQGTAEHSASLGYPAIEVEKGLKGITDTLEHLSLAEELQMKVKEDEERMKMESEERARLKREEEAAKRRREEEELERKKKEEAEQRKRDEEEQELRDEEERKKEEERIKKEEEERKAKAEQLRLAEEAGDEEERMWQSENEKTGSEDDGTAQDTTADTVQVNTADVTKGDNAEVTEQNDQSTEEKSPDKTTSQEPHPEQEKSKDLPVQMDSEESKVETVQTKNTEDQEEADEANNTETSPSPKNDEKELNAHL